MTLDPGRYECPDHHIDLTDQVEQALADDDLPPVAFRRAPGARPFRVIVRCPGDGRAGAHSLTCSGKRMS
jgi:hypothetical protein